MSESSAPAPVTVTDLSQAKVPSTLQVPQTPPSAPEVKPEAKMDEKLSSKFAALSRKSKELSERETKWKSDQEVVRADAAKAKAEADQYRDKYGRFATLEEKMKTDKRAGLKWLMEDQGATAEELSDYLLEELNPDPSRRQERAVSDIEKRLMDKITALEGKQTAKEQAELDKQKLSETERFEQTVTQVKTEIKQMIDGSDEYELIRLNEAYDTVLEVLEHQYNKTGRIMTYEEAAGLTESYLDEQATKQYEAKRAKQAAKPTEPAKLKTTSPTLSNTLSTEVHSAVETKPRTREESLRAAARLLKYNEE